MQNSENNYIQTLHIIQVESARMLPSKKYQFLNKEWFTPRMKALIVAEYEKFRRE